MKYVKIPKSYKVGGQLMEVRQIERCDGNDLGSCFLAGGYVEIADKCNKEDTQSESSKVNTFYHELTHSILKTWHNGNRKRETSIGGRLGYKEARGYCQCLDGASA